MATDITLYNKVVGTVEASSRKDALKRDENLLRALHLTVELYVTVPAPGTPNDHLKAVADAVTTAIGNVDDVAKVIARARTTFGVVLRAKDVKADDVYDDKTGAKYSELPHLGAVGHVRYGQVSASREFIRFIVEDATLPTLGTPEYIEAQVEDKIRSFWKPASV